MADRIILAILFLSLVKMNGSLRLRRREPATHTDPALQSPVPDTGQGATTTSLQPAGAPLADPLLTGAEVASNDVMGEHLPIPIPDSLPYYNGSDVLVDGCPRDEVMVSGVCHEVLTQGPCPMEEIVLLDPQNFQGYCAPRLCPPDRIFVFSDQLCHDPRNSGLCSGGRELFQTAFGTPVCQCPDGTYEAPMGGCELLLAPTPDCGQGQVHWFQDFASPQVCQVDPCGGLNLQRSASDLPFLPSHVDGVCHQLGQGGGACQQDTYFSMSLDTLSGVCSRLEDAGYLILDNQTMTNFEAQYGPFISKEVVFGINNNLLGGVVMQQQQQSGTTGPVTLPAKSGDMSITVVDVSTSRGDTATTSGAGGVKGFTVGESPRGSKTATGLPQPHRFKPHSQPHPHPRPYLIVVAGIPLGKPALDFERVTQLVRHQSARRGEEDSNISFISSREVGEYDFSNSREERRELYPTRSQDFARSVPVRNVIPGKLRLKTTLGGDEGHQLDIYRFHQALEAAQRADSHRNSGFYRSIMLLVAHHLKPATHHNRVTPARYGRERQQQRGRGKRSHREKRTVQTYFAPDNVFDNRLLACRSGAKRDINAKCRSRILPAHSPFQAFDSTLNTVIDDRLGKSTTQQQQDSSGGTSTTTTTSGRGGSTGVNNKTKTADAAQMNTAVPSFRTRGGGQQGDTNKSVVSISPLSPKSLCPQGTSINLRRGCDVIRHPSASTISHIS